MNALKKILSLVIIFILLLSNIRINSYASPNDTIKKPVKAAVFLADFKELFLSHIEESMENIQKENEGKVELTFFNANWNQSTQNSDISKSIDGEFDFFIINPASQKTEELEDILTRVADKKIPTIISSPPSTPLASFARNYPNTVIIGGDDEQSGVLKGKVVVDLWNSNKEAMDKNNDNILQYITLLGQKDSPATIARNKFTIQTLDDAGIKVQELSQTYCNWDEECARITIESNFLKHGGNIEIIISNSDGMAIGAIKALQKYGYNMGDKSKYIPVVGVGGFPEAIELIKQGAMAGTVMQNPNDYVNAFYDVGMNMLFGRHPLSGTNYKFDSTGNTIRLPYYEYTDETYKLFYK